MCNRGFEASPLRFAINLLFCPLTDGLDDDGGAEIEDFVGDADAYGTIADIYADMNDFDNAAKYYDLYLEEMRKVGYTPE